MQIQWSGFSGIDGLQQDKISARVERLAAQNRGVTNVRIAVQPTHHHRQGAQSVKVTCCVRGRTLAASCESEDFETSLHEALDDLERQLHTLRGRHLARRTLRAQVQG